MILNGGFEAHGNVKCIDCYMIYGNFPSVVYHWDNLGSYCILCDNRKEHQLDMGDKKTEICPIDKIKPQEGNAMIEMIYQPICGGFGCASHVFAKTGKTMQSGQVYEVSFWMYIPRRNKSDPEWAEHIGVALLPQKVNLHSTFSKTTRQFSYVPVDTIQFDNWFLYSKQIRLLCTSNYLTIGLFADDKWPVSRSYADVRYYIDNVKLVEVQPDSIKQDGVVNYCSRYSTSLDVDIQPVMDNIVLYFDSNLSSLNDEQISDLDSFARYAKRYPNVVFELSGHTDSIGANNFQLSQQRINSVLFYLLDQHKIPEARFITRSLADKNPTRTNSTAEGRQLNRRVDIRQTSISPGSVLYWHAIRSAKAGQTKEAFAYLNKWVLFSQSNPSESIVVLFDPRFDELRKSRGWAYLTKRVKEGYHKLKFPEYAFLFDSLRLDDRKYIGELSMILNDMITSIPGSDSFRVYMPRMPEELIKPKMKEHFQHISPILEKIGWPKLSEFGEGPSSSAFFLLQHSMDSSVYFRWLPEIENACHAGEARWKAYAMLYDRCNLISGKPQRYGTHFKIQPDGKIELEPCEGNLEAVNERRMTIGLSVLSE